VYRYRSKASLVFPLAAALGLISMGCAAQPILKVDALPVRHVVVYRNGVAYFERSGHVDRGEVRFKMKQKEVGDFLATLAVMEQGGSSVRAAAFPLDLGDDEAEASPKKEKTEDEKKGLRTVVLSLDGKAHDLQVGYVAESPVWKPSYRLVVHPEGEADLQAWGIVDNLSGEDWKDVKLSLIAGAPLSFEAQLGDPVVPPRPTVTDQGEVIAAVPRGETSLRQEAPTKKEAQADAESGGEGYGLADTDDTSLPTGQASGDAGSGSGAARIRAMGKRRPTPTRPPAVSAPAPPPAEAPAAAPQSASVVLPSQPRNLQSLAAIAAEGGTTRYDLPGSVTVPDKSATMVMLLARRVPGEALFLYAPDGGVPDSRSHPFRVARFTNKSGGVLERGPIAVFEEGSFLGQGLVDPLPDGAVATVPFALERSIAVEQERKWDEQGARLVKIENGELTVERDSVTLTKYRLRNGGDVVVKMLVKHARQSGTRLFATPKDTEDNIGTGSALVPARVSPHETGELVVDERATIRRVTDWFTPLADSAFKAYASDATANRDAVARLTAAWLLRDEIVKKHDARGKLQQESNSLSQSTEETRRNLHAVERNRVADALRTRLTQRLAEASLRLDEITKQIVELDAKLSELRIRFTEDIRDVKVWIPPTSTP
jgi:hypothetical protein